MFLSPSHFVREILLIFYLLTLFVCVLRNELPPFPRPPHNANGARALNLMECSGQLFRVVASKIQRSRFGCSPLGPPEKFVTFWGEEEVRRPQRA